MIYLYEDEGTADLYPLVDLKPVFDLRCGRHTLLEKLTHRYPAEQVAVWVRESHAALTAELHPELKVNSPFNPPGLFLCARAIFSDEIPSVDGQETIFVSGSHIAGFRLKSSRNWRPGCLNRLQLELPRESVKATLIRYPWDLVEQNLSELEKETAKKSPNRRKKAARRRPIKTLKDVRLVGPRDRLQVDPTARIWPGSVISTETGRVFIDREAQIRPGSIIEGPCYIGPGTIIDAARIRAGCSFGPQCRIGGEVEASVFQGFVNKHHDGFIGHSFVGEWVNLGALTTNSDLRNDYGIVKVIRGESAVDTGLLKVGCFIGDHAKTAIGTLLNTGTIVGTFASWFESGLSPKEIPPFCRGRTGRQSLEDILYTCRQVMSRRGRVPGPAYIALLTSLYERAGR